MNSLVVFNMVRQFFSLCYQLGDAHLSSIIVSLSKDLHQLDIYKIYRNLFHSDYQAYWSSMFNVFRFQII